MAADGKTTTPSGERRHRKGWIGSWWDGKFVNKWPNDWFDCGEELLQFFFDRCVGGNNEKQGVIDSFCQ